MKIRTGLMLAIAYAIAVWIGSGWQYTAPLEGVPWYGHGYLAVGLGWNLAVGPQNDPNLPIRMSPVLWTCGVVGTFILWPVLAVLLPIAALRGL